MKLTSIQYSQHDGTPEAWQLEKCVLNNINLVVGKNATGKTRMLNVIVELSNLLSGDSLPGSSLGNFTAIFDNKGVEMTYHLNLQNEVTQEQLRQGNTLLLSREANGRGQIFAEKLKQYVDFQLPTNELMVRRRDLLQYPFLMVIEKYIFSEEIRYSPHPKPCGTLSCHTAFKSLGLGILTL